MTVASKVLSLAFLSIGVFILMQVALPLISFKIWEIGQRYSQALLISPQPPKNEQVLGISIKNQDNFPSFISNLKRETIPNYSEFSLSIPALKIDSLVEVDSNDLSKKLAHLPGSALPGEKGNVFISGHSAASWIFGGFGEAIFAKLQDLKKGDQILLVAGGANFIYKVIDIKVVGPTDLSVINPPDELGRYITLMTCVPPGLNTKRLVILGKMI